MSRTPVTSSQLRAVGYDPATRTLEIEFTPSKKAPPGTEGSVYGYQNVPPELHAAFMAAESKGKFFGANIKNEREKYPYRKVG